MIAALLVLSWAVGCAVGGAGVAAPNWFYVPIAQAASRFSYSVAAPASLLAGVPAGERKRPAKQPLTVPCQAGTSSDMPASFPGRC
jgi:hypothetical protein